MPVKKKRTSKSVSVAPIELIVRRGALRRFDKLKQATAELPVKLTWDRRVSDGRGTVKARQRDPGGHGERRGAPPFTWDAADFLVVGKPAGERRRRPKR